MSVDVVVYVYVCNCKWISIYSYKFLYISQEKKERLIEEVRQMFGFRIDPKDDRFKEALEKKEQEEKRATKAARKLKKQQKMIADIQKMAQQGNEKLEGDNQSSKEPQNAESAPATPK